MCIILPQSSHYQAVNTALKLWLRSAAEIVIRHRVKSHSIEAKHGSASRLSRALLYLNDGFVYIDFCDIHRNYPFQSNTPFTFESNIDVSISGASILLMCVLLIPIFCKLNLSHMLELALISDIQPDTIIFFLIGYFNKI